MNPRQRMRQAFVSQFRNPRGAGGHVTGWIMSHRSSNVSRGRWAVDLLDVHADERVLELGCGPGVALAAIADRLVSGVAVGVDPSAVMVRQARRRNRAAIGARRVELICAAVEDLVPDGSALREGFDAVLAINNVGFWDQPELRLAGLRSVVRPGGRVALVTQPRCPGATAETSRAVADEMAALLDSAGYTAVTQSTLDLDPPAVYVQGIAPGPT